MTRLADLSINIWYFSLSLCVCYSPTHSLLFFSSPPLPILHLPAQNGDRDTSRSQNHRMVGAGRDLCGSPTPTPCRSRVTYSRLHRTLSRRVLNISREGDTTASLGSLCQGSVTLRGKKFFLTFRRNFLCFSLCPLPLVLSLGTTEKSLAPSS